MEWDLDKELEQLQRANAAASPVARLRAIHHRLAWAESASPATRLVTMVAAVEALCRSLIVHAAGRPASTAPMRYRQVLATPPQELVEEVLRLYGAPDPAQRFGADTWSAFAMAHAFREQIVHECVRVDNEICIALCTATEQVLKTLVEVGGLPRVVS